MELSVIGYSTALAALACWTVSTFAFTLASRRADPASINRVRILYAFILLSFLVCFANRISIFEAFTQVNMQQYIWFGLSGFVGLTLGDYYSFTGFKILGNRMGSLFHSFAPVAALLTGMLLLNEHLSWIGIVGVVVSLLGIIMLSLSRTEQDNVIKDGHGDFKRGVIVATLGGLCQGIGYVLAKKGFEVEGNHITAIHATWLRMFAASLSVYLIGAFKINLWSEFKEITLNTKKLAPALTGALFGPVIAISFSLVTATHLEVAIAQTIFSLLPVTVLFVSILLYKEKVRLNSYIAVLVSILGVIILVWRDPLLKFIGAD